MAGLAICLLIKMNSIELAPVSASEFVGMVKGSGLWNRGESELTFRP
jgi:hypothetical protein